MSASIGFKITGVSSSNFGYTLASAGDINGDGKPDLVIGAYGEGSSTGAAYIIYGASSYSPNTQVSTSMSTSIGFKITGASTSSRFGFALASAGAFYLP